MSKRFLTGVTLALSLLSTGASAAELRFSSFEPPAAYLTKNVFPEWGRRVAEATKGEVTVKMFPGGILGRSPAQQLQLVADGVADLAFIVPGYNPGVFPGMSVGELPYVVTNAKDGSKAMWKMYEKGMLKGDFEKYKIIGLFTTSPQGVASKGKIMSPTDINGKKFRASSPMLLTAIEKMGAVAVGGITAANLAESVSRGVIDGSFNDWNAIKSFRLMEAIDHVLEVPMGTSPLMVVMNRQKFESLSPAAKAGIDKVSGAAFAAYFGEQFDTISGAARAEAVKGGKIAITVPDKSTSAAWLAATRPSIDAWLSTDSKNAALLDAFTAAMK